MSRHRTLGIEIFVLSDRGDGELLLRPCDRYGDEMRLKLTIRNILAPLVSVRYIRTLFSEGSFVTHMSLLRIDGSSITLISNRSYSSWFSVFNSGVLNWNLLIASLSK